MAVGNPDFAADVNPDLQQGVVRPRPGHRGVERVGGVAGLAAVPSAIGQCGGSVPLQCRESTLSDPRSNQRADVGPRPPSRQYVHIPCSLHVSHQSVSESESGIVLLIKCSQFALNNIIHLKTFQ